MTHKGVGPRKKMADGRIVVRVKTQHSSLQEGEIRVQLEDRYGNRRWEVMSMESYAASVAATKFASNEEREARLQRPRSWWQSVLCVIRDFFTTGI